MDELSLPQPTPFRSWTPVAGPVDRQSFFDEQARRRRATWRWSAACILVVLAMGILSSIFVTPGTFIQVAWLTELIDIFLWVPRPWTWLIDAYLGLLEGASDGYNASPSRFIIGMIALILPTILLALCFWFWVRLLFTRAGIGGMLLTMGAREPRAGDLEEQQLVNIVQEMAIAAGLPPPRVMLLDADIANAATIGSSPQNATVIVSRRLLDEFDRDETQGVLAHLIGSIGNGDLRIIFAITSVFQTFGLMLAFLDAPISGSARRTLWRLIRYSLSPSASAAEGDEVGRLLVWSTTGAAFDDIAEFIDTVENARASLPKRVLVYFSIIVLMPIIFAGIFARLLLWFTVFFLLGPLLAITWRTRRYLADATAVQLTRNPDGLARGLLHLADRGGVIPGSAMLAHLFIVGPEAQVQRSQQRLAQRMAAMRAQAPEGRNLRDFIEQAREVQAVVQEHGQETRSAEEGTFAEQQGIIVSFHPSLTKRVNRLIALGARV